ncbi:MAG: energy transducer TonB [Bacteroidia bacterium]|nr:energy transducer TonB [Bacteroidia bacterium]
MKKVVFIFSLLISSLCFSQGDDFMLKDNLDRLPDNVGGKIEFQRFFEAHIIYPDKALKEKKEGTVKIKFIVLATGKGIKPSITESAGAELDNEALRLFRMLEWLPGEKQGEKVNTYHQVTFVFDIDKYKKYTHTRGFVKPKFDKKAVIDTSFILVERPDKIPGL